MALRNNLPCYICNGNFRPAVLSRLDGDGNEAKIEVAIRRRDEFNRPPLEIGNVTRLCLNCNRSVLEEIDLIQNNPAAVRLNILTQTASRSCVICNDVDDVHTLSIECRVNVFVS